MAFGSRLERLYAKAPIALQNVACSLYGIDAYAKRRGRFFRRKLRQLLDSEHYSREKIETTQSMELQRVVQNAYDKVPYYRKRMEALGITPRAIQSRADLPKLPILTKEEVRAHFAELLATDVDPKSLRLQHTSGTTGKALNFYWTRDQQAYLWAIWWRHRQRFGLEPSDWHANFTGKLVIPPEQSAPPYWRCNWPLRQWLFNMHHITPDKIESIVGCLNRHELAYYSGYPSIIHALAWCAEEQGLKLERRPRYVVTGAENVLDTQRQAIERFTGARIIDQYGFSEACGNASMCEQGVYHEDFEFGILECGDPETQADGSVRGRVICTGFANHAFPFIRYDVGDVAVWREESFRCECGRQSRVLSRILGRSDDYVITPEGRRIMRFDYLFKDTSQVREAQVVQERLGEIVLKLVRRPAYTVKDEHFIAGEVKRWISPLLRVRFDYVEQIEMEPNGKFRAVKSLLK
ncbi:MAG TPA: hypothetical protein VHM70_17895 [Polyangiaceae bacterium]|jgi:phenylacetate-CoA ligase|nr:hypothetical protein [Polyangiaceae bacterium]